MANRATSESEFNESIDVTPIPRSNSSPSILRNLPQVMTPNLVAGSASSGSHPLREPDIDAGAAQAMLQQWAEVKTEHGTMERTRVDELSGESMNARSRLDGLERRLGLESQQHQASSRELQAAAGQFRGDIQGRVC